MKFNLNLAMVNSPMSPEVLYNQVAQFITILTETD